MLLLRDFAHIWYKIFLYNVIYHNEGKTITLLYKDISLYILPEVKVSVLWERRTEWDKERLLYWPYHAALSWKPHVVLFLLLGRGTQPELRGAAVPVGALSDCKLALTNIAFNWPNSLTGICIYYLPLLPLIYPGASCSGKSLIDAPVTGQYAIVIPTSCKVLSVYISNLMTLGSLFFSKIPHLTKYKRKMTASTLLEWQKKTAFYDSRLKYEEFKIFFIFLTICCTIIFFPTNP